MSKMPPVVTSVEPYARGWLARRAERDAARARAMAQALAAARRAVRQLREDFGATRVVLFGSLARGDWVPEHSDIDVAIQGVAAADYLAAYGAVLGIMRGPVDLVRIEDAAPGLRRCIETEGQELS